MRRLRENRRASFWRNVHCGGVYRTVKLLEDDRVYWGNQIEIPGSDRCYGVVADDKHLLVCEYGCNGKEPQIVVYKRR